MRDGAHSSALEPAAPGGAEESGQTWYLSAQPIPGFAMAPIYREVSPNGSGTFDSTTSAERGSRDEITLGFGFDRPWLGTAQPLRYLDARSGVRVTPALGQTLPPAYSLDASLPVWAYPRYGARREVLETTSGNGVTAQINDVAGGAIWTWAWHGKQFIDTANLGRQMQMSLFYYDVRAGWRKNPNEAGDDLGPRYQHGSPLARSTVLGGVIETTTIPVEWNPAPDGLLPTQVEIYTTVAFSKRIDLNFRPGVASYAATYDLPHTLPEGEAAVRDARATFGEIPTAYLRREFDRYYAIDARLRQMNEVHPPDCNSQPFRWTPPSGYGGVAIATRSGAYAMGVYSKLDGEGGPTDRFELYDWIDRGCNAQVSKFAAIHTKGWPAGARTYTTYVLTGTLDSVARGMYALSRAGY